MIKFLNFYEYTVSIFLNYDKLENHTNHGSGEINNHLDNAWYMKDGVTVTNRITDAVLINGRQVWLGKSKP